MTIKWKSLRKRKCDPIVIPPILYYTGYNLNRAGFKFTRAIQVCEGGWYQAFFDEDNFREIGDFLLKKIKENKNLLNESLEESNEIAFKFLEFCKNYLNEESLKKEEIKKLLKHIKTYCDFYEEYVGANFCPWLFVDEKIFDELKKKMKEGDIILLFTPIEKSYVARFELALLKLILNIRLKNMKLDSFDEFLQEIKKDILLENEFNSVLKRFYWIPFDYMGPEIYDAREIFKMIKEKKLSTGELKLKIRELTEQPFILTEKQKELARKLNLDEETTHLLNSLKFIGTLLDVKKQFTTEAHYYFQLLVKELAKRTGVDYRGFYCFLPYEIEGFFKEGGFDAENFINQFEERKKNISVGDLVENRTYVLAGEEAEKFMKENNLSWLSKEKVEKKNLIFGSTAALGYILGKARILDSAKEMSKVQVGDILIATMTTPDYVPAMKKASAIITDEGGITSHAAIVARELGIPCIIGTENATKSFSDDDLLEVDARTGKGAIRKLSLEEFNQLKLGKVL